MTRLPTLARMKFWELRNRLQSFGEHSRFKVFIILFFATGFWVGLYAVFSEAFSLLRGWPDLADVIMESLLAVFFLSLTLMLVFSNGIIAYSSLYRSKESYFLLAAPLRYDEIFLYKYTESVVFSSWAFMFLGTPLMVAFGQYHVAGWGYYFGTLLFFASFIFIPAGLGAVIAVGIATFLPGRRRRILGILGGIAVLTILILLGRVLELKGILPSYSALWVKGIMDRFAFTQNPLLPSQWVTRGVLALRESDYRAAGFYFLTVVANGAFLTWLGAVMCRRWYMQGWSLSQSQGGGRKVALHPWQDRWLSPVLSFLRGPLREIVLKDIKTFGRDPVQWSQFLVFFGLLGVYFLNLRSLGYDIKGPFWKSVISFLNLSATCLTLSTFTSRFVYPQLSLEGRRFWVIGMIPMERRSILFAKLVTACLGSLLVSETLIVTSNLMLDIPWELSLLHIGTVAAICLGLSGLSVGLGAMFPNFGEDNPSKIVAGFGGTLNLVVSLFFVTVVILLEAVPCHQYYARSQLTTREFEAWMSASLGGIAFVCVLAGWIPMKLGMRALDRLEV